MPAAGQAKLPGVDNWA